MSRGHLLDWSVIGLLVVAGGWQARAQLGALVGLEGETLAPDLPLISLDGSKSSLMHDRGKVIVISFWATWCRECEPEIRTLRELETEFSPVDLQIYSLSLGSEPASTIRAYLEERAPDLWVGRATPELRAAFGGVPGVPTTFVIDRAGTIRHRFFGPLSTVALRTVVDRLVQRTL